MKKLILVIMILCIMTYGCQNEASVDKDEVSAALVQGIVFTEERYFENYEFKVDDLVNYDKSYLLKINGVVVKKNNINLKEGAYLFQLVDEKSNHIIDEMNITVYSEYNQLEYLSLENHEIRLDDIYREGHLFENNYGIFKTHFPYDVKVDGITVNESSFTLEVGKHDVEMIVYDLNGEVAHRLVKQLEIVSKDDDRYTDLRFGFYHDYPIPKVLLKTDIEKIPVLSQVYYHTADDVSLWNYINSDNLRGYYKVPRKERDRSLPLDVEFGKGEFETTVFIEEVACFEALNSNGYYVKEQSSYNEGIEYFALLNGNNFKLHKLDLTVYDLLFNSDKTMFLIKLYDSSTKRPINKRIFDLRDENMKVYENDFYMSYGISQAEWLDNETLDLVEVKPSQNEYFGMNERNMVTSTYSFNPELSKNERVKLVDENSSASETINLYKKISNNPLFIDSISSDDIVSSRFTSTISRVDNKQVLWFEVMLASGEKYYTFRKKNFREIIYFTYLDVLLDNDEIMSFDDEQEYYLLYDSAETLGVYIFKAFNEHIAFFKAFKSSDGQRSDINVSLDGSFAMQDDGGNIIVYALNNEKVLVHATIKPTTMLDYKFDWNEDGNLVAKVTDPVNNEYDYDKIIFSEGKWTTDSAFVEVDSNELHVEITTETLNVRERPTVDSNIVNQTRLYERHIVQGFDVDESNEVWYQIGNNQWIAARYCSWIVIND